MTGVLWLMVVSVVVGYPLASWGGVEDSRSGRLGLAFLLGSGTVATLLFALSFVPGGWTRAVVLVALGAVGAAGWLLVRPWRGARRPSIARPGGGSAFLLISAAMVIGHGLYASAAPPIEIDFLENWGLKAKVFWFAGGIDWLWLTREAVAEVRPDYPLLVPMLYDAVAILGGGWDDGSLGLLFTAYGAALLAVSEAVLRREHPDRTLGVPIAVVALTPLALTPWIGLGEGPLIAFTGAGAHMLDRARVRGSTAAALMGAVLLGLGALTKNEGLSLIVAAALALVVAGSPRLVLRLWPAAVLALAWIVPRNLHGLGTPFATGDPFARLFAQTGELLAALARFTTGKTLFWIALVAAFAVAGTVILRRERLRLTIVAVQFSFYVLAYLVTPHGVAWHVQWSWERVVSHLAFLLAFAAISGLLLRLGEASLEGRSRQ